MTIRATSTSRTYHPSQVRTRYVRLSFDKRWRWCEVGDNRDVDLRQGTCVESDLPADVAAAARARHELGVWPLYVEWPL